MRRWRLRRSDVATRWRAGAGASREEIDTTDYQSHAGTPAPPTSLHLPTPHQQKQKGRPKYSSVGHPLGLGMLHGLYICIC